MRYYYIDEAEGSTHHVLSAVGVDNVSWFPMLDAFQSWLKVLEAEHDVPAGRRLSARDLVGGRGWQGAQAFKGGLRVIEDAARNLGGIRVIGVCVEQDGGKDCRRLSLDRMLGRIHAAGAGSPTCLIFDQAREEQVNRLYRQLLEHGENSGILAGDPTNLGATFRDTRCDPLVLAANLVAHALLLQEEDLGLHRAYGILKHAGAAEEPAGYARDALRS